MKKNLVLLILLIPCIAWTGDCEKIGTNLYPGSYASQTLTLADVQQCVTNASDDDTINLKAGTVDWGASSLNIVGKRVNVIGAGKNDTIVSFSSKGMAILSTDYTKYALKISGINFHGKSGAQAAIQIGSLDYDISRYATGFRFDNLKFDNDAGISPTAVIIYGTIWGVIDNCDFYPAAAYSIQILISAAMPSLDSTIGGSKIGGSYDVSLPLDLGGSSAVYVEDCNFYDSTDYPMAYFDIDQGAGRIVLRHNVLGDGYFYTHESRGSNIGATKVEIYSNTFSGGSVYAQGSGYPGRLNSGTGVIYNNTFTSPGYDSKIFPVYELRSSVSNAPMLLCDGSHPWDGNVEANGWPCAGQIGRGSGTIGNQESAPLYAWNNGVESTCVTGGTCTNTYSIWSGTANYVKSTAHSNDEVDFVNNGSTSKPGYTAYTYPHPLRGVAPAVSTSVGISAGSGVTMK